MHSQKYITITDNAPLNITLLSVGSPFHLYWNSHHTETFNQITLLSDIYKSTAPLPPPKLFSQHLSL